MRKLALAATLAVASMAMTATTALAATQVRDADTGQLCPPVSPTINPASPPFASTPAYQSGGCTIHMTASDADLDRTDMAHRNKLPNRCTIDYDIHVGPDGWGYANNFQYFDSGSTSPCGNWAPYGSGSHVLAPPSFMPGAWPYANASTDFNTVWTATWTGDSVGSGSNFLSLDVTQGNPLVIRNQKTTGTASWYNNFIRGLWYGDGGLTITH